MRFADAFVVQPYREAVLSRIRGVDPSSTDGYVARVLTAQSESWGAPLANHLVYARCPAIFKAVRGMWGGLDASGLIAPALVGLVNRRVASLNGCVF